MSPQVIGASDEQLDVFNEVWYSLLLNTGQATKGMTLVHRALDLFHNGLLDYSGFLIYLMFNLVIEVIERRFESRDGVPFLWRLLVWFFIFKPNCFIICLNDMSPKC